MVSGVASASPLSSRACASAGRSALFESCTVISFFHFWINKAGTVNNNIVGMGRKTKKMKQKKRAIRFMLTSE
nr:hypothetical protein [Escherichia coli]